MMDVPVACGARDLLWSYSRDEAVALISAIGRGESPRVDRSEVLAEFAHSAAAAVRHCTECLDGDRTEAYQATDREHWHRWVDAVYVSGAELRQTRMVAFRDLLRQFEDALRHLISGQDADAPIVAALGEAISLLREPEATC